jgi:mRNA interferase HigB
VHVLSKRRLQEFWHRHPDAEAPLRAWHAMMRGKRYGHPHELRADFPAASLLGAGRTVFNIGGNKYRLVVTMRYDMGRVFVRHVLTHAAYDRLAMEGAL